MREDKERDRRTFKTRMSKKERNRKIKKNQLIKLAKNKTGKGIEIEIGGAINKTIVIKHGTGTVRKREKKIRRQIDKDGKIRDGKPTGNPPDK